MKDLKITSQFKKDLKRYQNQPKRIEILKVVLGHLQQGTPIPQEYKPHKLLGEYKDCMECHIESDTHMSRHSFRNIQVAFSMSVDLR